MIDNIITTCVVVVMCAYSFKISKHEVPAPRPGINEELQPYVDRFHDLLKVKCGGAVKLPAMNMDIGEANYDFLNPNVVGWCMRLSPLQMMIDRDYFDSSSDLEREQLIFHELGHCVLDKDHDESLDDNKKPNSLMYPETLPESTYKGKYKQYIDELMSGFSCKTLENGVDYED